MVAISNPERKNAVNDVLVAELQAEIARAERDSSVRALVLTGSGHVFCSGADMEAMGTAGRAPETAPAEPGHRLHPHASGIRAAVLGLRRLSKPAIAAVNGAAVGSGIGLAAGCDLRIASDRARFGWVFTRRGIVPDDGSLALLLQLIGYAGAFEWGAAGRTLSAQEAREIGFVQRVVPHEELLPSCLALAAEITENAPPITLQLFKRALAEAAELSLEAGTDLAERAYQAARATDDHAEAVRAYLERRRPQWRNR